MSRSRPKSAIDLGTLLRDERDSTPAHIADAAEKSFDAIPGGKLIPLDRIDTWERQPRKSFDETGIAELAASIASSGILEPLVVRRQAERPGRYVIIAGHRRLLAARRVRGSEDTEERARVEALPCVIREATDDSAFADALVENLVRKDLTRREMMDAVKALKDEYGWSVREIARRTGRNQHDLSVLARIAADDDLSQLVADEIISPTAVGVLVEEKHRPFRYAIIADIRAGRLKTVDDVERAVAAAHEMPGERVSDITHPLTWQSTASEGGGVSDITHLSGPLGAREGDKRDESWDIEPAWTGSAPGRLESAPTGEAQARTVPVQAHERRIGSVSNDPSRLERALTACLAEMRACLPLDEAGKAKVRAFASNVLVFIDGDA